MLSTMRSATLKQRATRAMSSAAPAREASILDGFFRKSAMPSVPLNNLFPGTVSLAPSATPVEAGKVTTSTLANGLRVATVESNSPLSSIGVFINSGSRHEQPGINGISNFIEHIAFKSTESISDFRLVRDMLKVGGDVTCSTTRDSTFYAANCMRTHMPYLVETLGDVITKPLYLPDELEDARTAYASEVEYRNQQTDALVMEAIHAAAYSNNTLGHSLYAPVPNLASFTPEVLRDWTSHFFTPSRMVVSAVGVDHDAFCASVTKSFAGLAADKSDLGAEQKAEYTGGDIRNHRTDLPDGLTHLAIAFETASWHDKDLVPMCVLQMMMGGGGSFSSGGPGKGMYSRLYENVLQRHGWIESALSFNSIFADSSLFGIYGTAAPQHSAQLVDAISQAAATMGGQVGDVELSRAKNQLKSAVHMQLETRGLQLEDAGRQLMIYGRIKSAKEMCAEIDAVTSADIQRTAQAMLKTTPSVAAFGDLSYLPRYDVVAKRFG